MFPFPIIAPSRDPIDLTYINKYTNLGPRTNWSVSSVSIGTEHANRHVIIALAEASGGSTAEATSALTVNGVSATRVVVNPGGTSLHKASIWIAAVPTGTSVTVAGTCAISVNQTVFGVFTVTNIDSATPISTGEDDNGSTSTDYLEVSVTKDDGAACVGIGLTWTNGPITWTGLGTEDFDYAAFGNGYFSAAHEVSTTSGNTNIRFDPATNYSQGMAVAIWR